MPFRPHTLLQMLRAVIGTLLTTFADAANPSAPWGRAEVARGLPKRRGPRSMGSFDGPRPCGANRRSYAGIPISTRRSQ